MLWNDEVDYSWKRDAVQILLVNFKRIEMRHYTIFRDVELCDTEYIFCYFMFLLLVVTHDVVIYMYKNNCRNVLLLFCFL